MRTNTKKRANSRQRGAAVTDDRKSQGEERKGLVAARDPQGQLERSEAVEPKAELERPVERGKAMEPRRGQALEPSTKSIQPRKDLVAQGDKDLSDYIPTPREGQAIKKWLDATEFAPPRLKIEAQGNNHEISYNHKSQSVGDVLLMDAVGTKDPYFLHGLLVQLGGAAFKGGQPSEKTLNFMAAVVTGLHPKDQQEAMLAAQMAAVHTAAMNQAGRLADAVDPRQVDSAERAFNKLTRTFISQLDALKRYRSSGAQRVTVQRVSVEQGGQAIVGNVTHVQRAAPETETALDLTAEPIESAQPAGVAPAHLWPLPPTVSGQAVTPKAARHKKEKR